MYLVLKSMIITNSSFDAPGGPLIEEMGWKTIDELITCESKTIVFKSLNQLAPEHLCGLSLEIRSAHHIVFVIRGPT